ncbi:MAG: hypothetical protein O3B13_25010, partial [Planctomycetota bacterium]|nr:hypothetical protein [Planctomycetota bacterium]
KRNCATQNVGLSAPKSVWRLKTRGFDGNRPRHVRNKAAGNPPDRQQDDDTPATKPTQSAVVTRENVIEFHATEIGDQ